MALDLPFEFNQPINFKNTIAYDRLPVVMQWQGRRLGTYIQWGLQVPSKSEALERPVTLVDAFSIFRHKAFSSLIKESRCLIPADPAEPDHASKMVTYAGIWQRQKINDHICDAFAVLGTFQILPDQSQTIFYPTIIDMQGWQRWLKPKTNRYHVEKMIEQGSRQPCAGKTPAYA